jgi:hypothetical protein
MARSACIILVIFSLIGCVPASGPMMIIDKTNFEVKFVNVGFSCPEYTSVLSLEPSGNLYDIDGHAIEDDDLPSLLALDRVAPFYFKLMVLKPEKTNLKILIQTIGKLRRSFKASQRVVLYVAIEGGEEINP